MNRLAGARVAALYLVSALIVVVCGLLLWGLT